MAACCLRLPVPCQLGGQVHWAGAGSGTGTGVDLHGRTPVIPACPIDPLRPCGRTLCAASVAGLGAIPRPDSKTDLPRPVRHCHLAARSGASPELDDSYAAQEFLAVGPLLSLILCTLLTRGSYGGIRETATRQDFRLLLLLYLSLAGCLVFTSARHSTSPSTTSRSRSPCSDVILSP